MKRSASNDTSRESAAPDEKRWRDILDRLLAEIDSVDELYRPTNFWGPGVAAILNDIERTGFGAFKSWKSDAWFYPKYGLGLSNAQMDSVYPTLHQFQPRLTEARLRSMLGGSLEARRDLHATELAWDQQRWPFDIRGYGDSDVGQPRQRFRLAGPNGPRWSKPYLNYLLCLAALSRHVDAPPKSFLEIGGGYGVLGEILLARDPSVRYVDCDIPPLIVVAAYYLSNLFDSVHVPDSSVDAPFAVGGSGTITSWQLPYLTTEFEVFVNSYSFQEMEPKVVSNYIDLVTSRGIRYAVSLNSVEGKRRAKEGTEGGALDPVTSDFIADQFASRGFDIVGRYREPLIVSAGELIVAKRSD